MTDQRVNIQQLLRAMVEMGASDMHVTTGAPPLLRVDGRVVPLKLPPLGREDTRRLCFQALTEEQRKRFEDDREVDVSFGVKGLARFRANVFYQRASVAAAFRTIPFKILTPEELGLPTAVGDLAARSSGLVLVTGPTGAGKSTTLAALLDKINNERRVHIVTVEDPIEFLHPHKLAVVNQREVGTDTSGYVDALKHVLRQDPDVVLVGEMRDLETIEAVLNISETGHLVFSTLHTNGAVSTISRIVDMFPPHQQPQIRAKLAAVLQGVISQQLVPRAGAPGRVVATEILIPNPAVRSLIREDKIHQIYGQMQVGQDRFGMRTLNQSLHALISRRAVTLDEALTRTPEPDELKSMVESRA